MLGSPPDAGPRRHRRTRRPSAGHGSTCGHSSKCLLGNQLVGAGVESPDVTVGRLSAVPLPGAGFTPRLVGAVVVVAVDVQMPGELVTADRLRHRWDLRV